MPIKIMGVNFRILEIHIFYNCGLFYWHLIEILWLFIFLVFYYLDVALAFSLLILTLQASALIFSIVYPKARLKSLIFSYFVF